MRLKRKILALINIKKVPKWQLNNKEVNMVQIINIMGIKNKKLLLDKILNIINIIKILIRIEILQLRNLRQKIDQVI